MKKVAVRMDGGMGRTLCAIPSLLKLSKNVDVTILAYSFPEMYSGLGLKVVMVDEWGLYREHVSDKEILCPEPYYNLGWRKGKLNIVEAFAEELGVKLDSNLPALPSLKGVSVDDLGTYIILQPDGAMHSMTNEEVQTLLQPNTESESPLQVYSIGTERDFDGVTKLGFMPTLCYIKYIVNASKFFGVESSGYHIAASAGVPNVVLCYETSGYKLYDTSTKIIREGYEDAPIVSPRL